MLRTTRTSNPFRITSTISVRPASVTNVRFIQSKTFIDKQIKDKYRAKLEAIAKAKGISNANEIFVEMKDKIQETKKELDMIDPLKELEDYEQAMNIKKLKKTDAFDKNTPKSETFKTLESYLVLDKVKELGIQEIEFLWRAKFAKDERSIVAVAPVKAFNNMYQNARKYPTFVLPLPRGDEGMEIHFVQWSFVGPNTTHVMITTLLEYKLHKEYARPHTTLAFHSELAESNEVVLMQGHVDDDRGVSVGDAQMLLLNLQRFYGGFGTSSDIEKKRIEVVKGFNTGNFDMDECIELAQSMEN